jgi:carbon starvation protein
MAFSTFVFDTLDVSTRLGRYLIQELFGLAGRFGALVATAATVLVPMVLVAGTSEGAYRTFWTLFGTSNQLLAALTLLSVSVWLRRTGYRCWFTVVPMLFVMTITLWSLAIQARDALAAVVRDGSALGTGVHGVVALVLIGLAGFLIVEGGRLLVRPEPRGAGAVS